MPTRTADGNTIYCLEDTLPLRKHKGEQIAEVIENDPKYMEWAVQNVPWFELSYEAYEELQIQLQSVRMYE